MLDPVVPIYPPRRKATLRALVIAVALLPVMAVLVAMVQAKGKD